MKRKAWKERIKKACKEAGTYKPYFDIEIDLLARTLENRDKAQESYEANGSQPVVEIQYGKSVRKKKNPILEVVDSLNRDAKEYMHDLGLTPQALNKINSRALKSEKEKPTLGDILRSLDV